MLRVGMQFATLRVTRLIPREVRAWLRLLPVINLLWRLS